MKWRKYVVSVAAIWIALVAIYAMRPYGSTQQLIVPAGVKAETASYSCGALWGSGYVHSPSSVTYHPAGTPCSSRNSDRLMTFVDVAVGIGVILVVCWWPIEGEQRRGAFTWPFGAHELAD